MNKEQANQLYAKLASELGDTEFKLHLLGLKKAHILKQINDLNHKMESHEAKEKKSSKT